MAFLSRYHHHFDHHQHDQEEGSYPLLREVVIVPTNDPEPALLTTEGGDDQVPLSFPAGGAEAENPPPQGEVGAGEPAQPGAHPGHLPGQAHLDGPEDLVPPPAYSYRCGHGKLWGRRSYRRPGAHDDEELQRQDSFFGAKGSRGEVVGLVSPGGEKEDASPPEKEGWEKEERELNLAFIRACHRGNLGEVKRLYLQGSKEGLPRIDVNFLTTNNATGREATPLSAACCECRDNVVQYLISLPGIRPNFCGSSAPVIEMARYRPEPLSALEYDQCFRALCSHPDFDVNASLWGYTTAITQACVSLNTDMIEALLAYKPLPFTSQRPLEFMVMVEKDSPVIHGTVLHAVLAPGSRPDLTSDASEELVLDNLNLLLRDPRIGENERLLNAKNQRGETFVHRACMRRSEMALYEILLGNEGVGALLDPTTHIVSESHFTRGFGHALGYDTRRVHYENPFGLMPNTFVGATNDTRLTREAREEGEYALYRMRCLYGQWLKSRNMRIPTDLVLEVSLSRHSRAHWIGALKKVFCCGCL